MPTAPLATEIPWLLGLFAVTLGSIARTMGTSPAVWEDTLIENLFVQDCVTHNRCTGVGAGATVGIFHSAGYLHWRSLLWGMGLHTHGTYLVLLVLSALGVVLTALVAWRLAGRGAGALAALLALASIGYPTQLNVISDVAPLPFLGAVFLLMAMAAYTRPGLRMTALLGMVGGVMANVYATSLLCGVSCFWIALRMPHRHRAHAVVAMASFLGSTYVISPDTWITNLGIVTMRHVHHLGNAVHDSPDRLWNLPMAWLTALAVLTWGVFTRRNGPLRERLHVPAAIIVPLAVVYGGGILVGRINPQPKYFAHVISAVVVCAAIGGVSAARAIQRRAQTHPSRYAPWIVGVLGGVLAVVGVVSKLRLPVGHAGPMDHGLGDPVTFAQLSTVVRSQVHGPLLLLLATYLSAVILAVLAIRPRRPAWADATRLAPYLAIGVIAFGGVAPSMTEGQRSVFTSRELDAVAHLLGGVHQWSIPRAALNLRTPNETVRRAAFRSTEGWATEGRAALGGVGELERAYVLKVPFAQVPQPLPVGVERADTAQTMSTLVAFTCSWIDWRSFVACLKADGSTTETCTPSSLQTSVNGHADYDTPVPGIPTAGLFQRRQTLTLHIPLTPSPGCPDAWIHMPQLHDACRGRIVGIDGSTHGIDAGGLWARLHANASPGAAPPRELTVAWDVGGPTCQGMAYRGYLPFFIEGDPRTVTLVTDILETEAP